ncbi:FAD-binding oxidoreductase [Paracoccus siganidrum]|uniref:FAD-binding oxidoreductase n=1 Tax=Paracoccus siganidrum TaxID=1276757 RepID=A0A419AC85_9RHOB|nr:FAD-binding oxidoreductase [Paracoccus siganidrum]RJL21814.1 FAD-binding oxidoreductase [Paracoccus siganidrum]RMC38175.1 FAD-binding oxidoreductase [Paracoccus siganidrum]
MMWYDSRAAHRRRKIAQWTADAALLPPGALPPELAAELQQKITGTVVLPGDPDYDADRMLSNPRFSAHPAVIVYCETEADVAECLDVAQRARLAVVVRSGGHSTGGFSAQDGFLLDVSRLNDVVVEPEAMTAWAGPGTQFRKLNAKLEFLDLHTPGGACPDVCVGGYMQGGGYGFTARIFGVNCDQVLAVRVMLADGRMVEADAKRDPDLFWAVRGGTGSNFGVLLGVKYRLYRGARFTGFSIRWQMEDGEGRAQAAAALEWLQAHFMRGDAAPDLGYQMIWAFEGPEGRTKTPRLLMRGMYRGALPDLKRLLVPVIQLPGAVVESFYDSTPYSELNRCLLSQPYEVPDFPQDMQPMPPPEAKLSRYIEQPLSAADWRRLIDCFLDTPSPYTIAAMEIYGGAIERGPDHPNAFLHRRVCCDLFFDVFWLSETEREVMADYLERWRETVAPFWNGRVYQNYPSPHDPDFGAHYWGEDYDRLRAVKSRYDPGDLFRYPQSIRPLPAATAAT